MYKGFTIIQNKIWVSLRLFFAFALVGLLILASACSELEKPKTEEFYAVSDPPLKQEFRWSNGMKPNSFDPAQASAPPETDIVRAVYDGLTESDPNSLKAIPSIANDWESSDDHKVWTFKLRKDAKWSNGEKVTANDFVSSWKRLADMGDQVAHYELLKNIVGLQTEKEEVTKKKSDVTSNETKKQILKDSVSKELDFPSLNSNSNTTIKLNKIPPPPPLPTPKVKKEVKKTVKFGVEAIDEYTLKVSLIKSDKDFPKLVSHPILRPVYAAGKEFEDDRLNSKIVTNGAFRIKEIETEGLLLERSENYYAKDQIKLEKVRFVFTKDGDSALLAYRRGEVDAVTNAQFEPLALKLLTPYYDFRRTTHSALNFYEFNKKNPPFNDRRVREALAISIERKRLTDDDMDGATKPAVTYLPFDKEKKKNDFTQNVAKAKGLLDKSGFPNGDNFPKVRLIVNRNDVQQRLARSVAKMWKDNLNIETDIVVKENEEIESTKQNGEFDLIRRGIVLPTSDETANMLAIFAPKESSKIEVITKKEKKFEQIGQSEETTETVQLNSNTNTNTNILSNNSSTQDELIGQPNTEELLVDIGDEEVILTEEQALIEVPAIPLYFPTSYSLVKPYVKGFEMNTLDAPLLKNVEIDNYWQPKREGSESKK